MTVIGLINPGQMGASIGAAARQSGARVIWAGENRSPESHRRATKAGIEDCASLEKLVGAADVILSVCPPADAEAIAAGVKQAGYTGVFVDCNAISPRKSRQISGQFERRDYVDGGIIGGPAWTREAGTRLYLSGDRANEVSAVFDQSPLHTRILDGGIGAASAMKMVYAAYTKGSTALLTAILGVAESEGVRGALEAQWGQTFAEKTHQQVTANSAKAWRFAGEMREIAETFQGAGLPGGFHEAAAEVFDQLSEFKDAPADDIAELLKVLNQASD